MAEFKFVLKCFIFACALVALIQLKTNGMTIESHIQKTLLSTGVSDFINQTAQGGVKFFEKVIDFSKDKISQVSSGVNFSSASPSKQVIRYPAAKKTVDNSDLRTEFRKSSEISHDADFNYDSDLE